ncbi:MAG TPA: phosphoenolpyruvate--protein phosphotransferase [Gemmatimonadaceae bacterium]|nr:phosphoenolpyruvate--protein phosphotransferase [Gemmatimonadaceae bacterium]
MSHTVRGVSASPGVAVGRVHLLRWEVPEVVARVVSDDEIPAELDRLAKGIDSAIERLRRVRERAEHNAGPQEAAIFDVQISILEDTELRGGMEKLIRQNFSAEKAADLVLYEWRQNFARHHHAMLRERVGDLTDVHIRLLTMLLGLPDHDPIDVKKGASAILVTRDLTPSLTVQLDRESIAGIATEEGTRTSHVAILARSLGLPAVVGLRDTVSGLRGGERVVLDGSSGTLIINATDADVSAARAREQREREESDALSELASAESVTLDGERVVLRANVDLPEESGAAAIYGAEGVGLMRTEFLVVGRAAMPDEDEQYAEYRRVLEAFPGRAVVIRTYDIGGDKLPVGGFPSEANPFLGWRAIRMCLDQPELFKVQLRALLRAAVHGDLRIMLPLVTSVAEVREARVLLAHAAAELQAIGEQFRADVPLGVMIETPAAAVMAHTFVGDVSFFSIGTNDLTQYTLAVDRGNANLASRFRPLHPAVLTLIKQTADVAHANKIEIAVCGEMASEPLMAFALIGLGLRSLSVAPRSVPRLKQIVRAIHLKDAVAAAEEALRTATAEASEQVLQRRLNEALGR